MRRDGTEIVRKPRITRKELADMHTMLERAGVPDDLRRLDAEVVDRLTLWDQLLRWWRFKI